MWREREGGREEEREGGREGGRKGGRKEGREEGREGGKEREAESEIEMLCFKIECPLTNQGDRHSLVEGRNSGPLPSPLLAGRVTNLLNEWLSIGVLVGQDVSCDFDEEGVEFTFVPLPEYLRRER